MDPELGVGPKTKTPRGKNSRGEKNKTQGRKIQTRKIQTRKLEKYKLKIKTRRILESFSETGQNLVRLKLWS